jgi:hypothetical protein
MSHISALINANKVVRAFATTPPLPSQEKGVYVTVGGWPAFSKLKRVVVTSGMQINGLTVEVLTSNGAHRSAEPEDQPAFLQVKSTTSGSSSRHEFLFEDIYIEDGYRTGHLHLFFSYEAGFDEDTVFTVMAEGVRTLPFSLRDIDMITPYSGDKTVRVIRHAASGEIVDLTPMMLGNGNPYGPEAKYTAFADEGDYLYVGSESRRRLFEFILAQGSNQPHGSRLEVDLFTDVEWLNTSVADSTASTAANTLSYSGVMELEDSEQWVPTRLEFDPLEQLDLAIQAGEHPAIAMLYNPPRYWARFSVKDGEYPVRLMRVIPLKADSL